MCAARLVGRWSQSGSSSPDCHNIWSLFLRITLKSQEAIYFFQRDNLTLHTSSKTISCMLWRTEEEWLLIIPVSPRPARCSQAAPQPRLPRSLGSAASGRVLLVTGSSGGSASSKKNRPSSHSYPLSTSIFLTSLSVFGDR